ncbi:hypothetical protein C0995_002214 [Termitomyces sp. Mi166|nr:hypothetical protein C0995_002214 [Termitomyces sp. Mi166\
MSSKTMSSSSKPKPKPKGKVYVKKATPKQPLSTAERLRRLFTSLCAQIDGGHFGNAIKTCDKILRLEPTDTDAHQTKLFLLLQTEQYDAALSLIDNIATGGHAFERAYTLYRLQREEEAKVVLQQVKEEKGDDDRAAVHLEAQMSYRSGSYDQAVELYTQLLETAELHSEEHTDILTNLGAAQAHLDFTTTGFLHALGALPTSLTSTIQSAPPPPPPSSQPSSSRAVTMTTASSPEKDKEKDEPKKPRKSRLPPGVIPGVTPPPDPERWVKKTERSTWGGKRRKGGGGATQGNVSVDGAAATTTGATKGKGKGKKK